MFIPGLPLNIIPNVAAQAVSGLINRASSGAKGFESDLDSGNLTGAQSFLTALQQKLSTGNAGGSGSALSAEIAQVKNDLDSGDLIAAHADFATLKMALVQRQHQSAHTASNCGNQPLTGPTQNQIGLAQGSPAALVLSNTLMQKAFASAVNLSVPSSVPSLSISM